MRTYFFIRGRKFHAWVSFFTFLFVIKKVLKIRFFKHGEVVNTRRSVLTYILYESCFPPASVSRVRPGQVPLSS
jgi:uncharacterized membrane protein